MTNNFSFTTADIENINDKPVKTVMFSMNDEMNNNMQIIDKTMGEQIEKVTHIEQWRDVINNKLKLRDKIILAEGALLLLTIVYQFVVH